MAFVQIGDRVLVTIKGALCGRTTLTTFLYRVSAVAANTDYDQAMTALHGSFAGATQIRPKYVACCPSNWLMDAMWYQIISPLRYHKFAQGVAASGGFGSVANTPNVQGSITRIGEFAGRKYVGGIRVPIGTDDVSCNNGVLTANQKSALQGLADAMKLNVITSGVTMTVIPQVGLPAAGGASADLYNAFVQDTVRVIRRRTVGLGI